MFKLIQSLLLLMIIEGDERDVLYVQTNAETLWLVALGVQT